MSVIRIGDAAVILAAAATSASAEIRSLWAKSFAMRLTVWRSHTSSCPSTSQATESL
jgi:hypothetical protein